MPIHSSAIVAPDALIAPEVEVGPYAIIEAGVRVGRGCRIGAMAILRRDTWLGENVTIDSHAVIGGNPQDVHFDPNKPSGVKIGAGSMIREGVTIHRSTRENGFTMIGEKVFIMANAHVAHDCVVGDHAIVVNGVLLAGHVEIQKHAFLGGAALFHQFVRVGESAIVSGGSRVAHDVPPFVLTAERSEVHGLNLVGLKRRGFGQEVIDDLKKMYKAVYGRAGNRRHYASTALNDCPPATAQGQQFLEFFLQPSKRGFIEPAVELKNSDVP